MLETVKKRALAAIVLMLLGFGLGMTYVAASAYTWWPEGYTGFEFEAVGNMTGDATYVRVKVTKVHGLAGVKVGDIYYFSNIQPLREGEPIGTARLGRIVGEYIINGRKYIVALGEDAQEYGEYSISGKVYPGYVNNYRYPYLSTTQRVDIEFGWTPTSQSILLGLTYWRMPMKEGFFYGNEYYDGYAEVSIYPPYNGQYSIGVGGSSWNQDPIDYHGKSILGVPEIWVLPYHYQYNASNGN